MILLQAVATADTRYQWPSAVLFVFILVFLVYIGLTHRAQSILESQCDDILMLLNRDRDNDAIVVVHNWAKRHVQHTIPEITLRPGTGYQAEEYISLSYSGHLFEFIQKNDTWELYGCK